MKKFRTLLLLLALFAVSVGVRWDFLSRPFSDKGWVSAHVLITNQIWQEEGALKFSFAPVYTYSDLTCKHHPFLGGVGDKEGRYYYVSYPPFAFIGTRLFFLLTPFQANEFGLRWFNMLLQLVCAILIYLIVAHPYKKRLSDEPFFPAVVSAALYLLSAGNLLFHSEIFFSDMMVQPFFLGGVLFFLRFVETGSVRNRNAFLVCSAFALYSEWLGLFWMVTAGLYLLLFPPTPTHRWKEVILLAFVGIGVLGLTILQYVSISGWDALVEASVKKYALRSGMSGTEGSEHGFSYNNPNSYEMLAGHYDRWYLALENIIGLFLPLALIILLVMREKLAKGTGRILIFLFIPVILHHLVFFNFNVVHDMGALKVITLLIVLIGFFTSGVLSALSKFSLNWLFVSILSLFFSIKLYESISAFRKEFSQHFLNSSAYEVGIRLREHLAEGELAATNIFPSPELFYYSHRNVMALQDLGNVHSMIRDDKYHKAVYVHYDGAMVSEIVRLQRGANGEVISETIWSLNKR